MKKLKQVRISLLFKNRKMLRMNWQSTCSFMTDTRTTWLQISKLNIWSQNSIMSFLSWIKRKTTRSLNFPSFWKDFKKSLNQDKYWPGLMFTDTIWLIKSIRYSLKTIKPSLNRIASSFTISSKRKTTLISLENPWQTNRLFITINPS